MIIFNFVNPFQKNLYLNTRTCAIDQNKLREPESPAPPPHSIILTSTVNTGKNYAINFVLQFQAVPNEI